MTADNEHMVLKRPMERCLGRSVSPAAWDFAAEQGFVEDADPVYGTAGQDGLLRFLTGLLRVEDGGLRARSTEKSKALERLPRASPDLSARIEAVSRLAAEHAAGDEEIIRFRQRVLGRDTPLSAEEAESYLDLPEARGTSPREGGRTELLKYQNRHVSHDLHVWAGSPLDDLGKLAESLAKFYP